MPVHSALLRRIARPLVVRAAISPPGSTGTRSHRAFCHPQYAVCAAAAAAAAATTLALWTTPYSRQEPIKNLDIDEASETPPLPAAIAGHVRTDLPTYSLSEVQQHTDASQSGSTWVVYKHGVYNITPFVASHPGGTKILLAAGKSIEPFWQLYAAHNHADVHKVLETLRVGNLHADDVATLEAARKQQYGDGPYSRDPVRHPALKVNSSMPFNAEPPPELLMESFLTPNDLFFVRNHLPVPEVDTDTFTLKIAGVGVSDKTSTVEFTLDELKSRFKHHTVTTTVQCAGNRRAEMSRVKQVNGLSWDTTALSTAKWTGVLLADVLASVGVTDEDAASGPCEGDGKGDGDDQLVIQHVQFEGLDVDTEGNCYGASIPISTALDPRKDVLLAFEMNGEPIPRDHGYPLRAIVPGTVGARNVKFVHRIVLSSEESPSFWQQRDYKGFPPNVDYSRDDFWKFAGDSIQELPVQSAITEPKDDSIYIVDDASDSSVVTVKGYAWSGGGRNIIRVDVSVDGGKTWTPADLHESGKRQKYNRAWAWTPWELDVELPPGTKKVDIICKAVDISYNVQPDTIAPIWNMRGVLNNAWHRVHVSVEGSRNEAGKGDEEDESGLEA